MLSDKEDNVPFPVKCHSSNDLDFYFDHKPTENLPKEAIFPHTEQFLKPQSRHQKFQYEKYLKKPKEIDRSDPLFQKSLRRKFVETAKKYLGIPYNKKFFLKKITKYKFFVDTCNQEIQIMTALCFWTVVAWCDRQFWTLRRSLVLVWVLGIRRTNMTLFRTR